MCFNLFSSMSFNNLMQSFPNNPDSHAQGFATFKLCTNGSLIADTALVYGGQTPLIASHIHMASNGDGETGSGPPVISFCGSNTPGLINVAGPYPEPCAPYMGGSSNNANMMGYFIPGENEGTSLSQRVLDIAANPGKYYFNFHSIASWAYWSAQNPSNPQPVGMCRGVMKSSSLPMEKSNTISLGAALDLNMASAKPKDAGTDDMCFNLFTSMAYNNLLQSLPNNPDSHAEGMATFKLCTNGTLIADTALVYGGQTPLIASHIHRASNDDGENGSGPPVISFCGSNTPGLINAAGPYPEPCAPYMGGSSNNANMMGYFIPGENEGTSLSQRVLDIAANPGKYYFNFHSIASWAYWSAQNPSNPQPVGMCRGVMKSSSLPMEQSNTISLGAALDLNMASAKPKDAGTDDMCV